MRIYNIEQCIGCFGPLIPPAVEDQQGAKWCPDCVDRALGELFSRLARERYEEREENRLPLAPVEIPQTVPQLAAPPTETQPLAPELAPAQEPVVEESVVEEPVVEESTATEDLGEESRPTLKTCKKCEKDYPANADYFYRTQATKDGFDGACKACRNEQERIRESAPHPTEKEASNSLDPTEWLKEKLAGGERYSKEVTELAQAEGVSSVGLAQARKALGVLNRPILVNKKVQGWAMRLPGETNLLQPLTSEVASETTTAPAAKPQPAPPVIQQRIGPDLPKTIRGRRMRLGFTDVALAHRLDVKLADLQLHERDLKTLPEETVARIERDLERLEAMDPAEVYKLREGYGITLPEEEAGRVIPIGRLYEKVG